MECVLAIDIGATFIKYAWIDRDMKISESRKEKTPKTSLEALEQIIFKIVEENSQILGIGISCPGTVIPATGEIISGGGLPYLHGVNFKERLTSKYNLPVVVQNDAKAAAHAELKAGCLKGIRDAVVLVLGSGIGGCIILGGELREGYHHYSGEVSFIQEIGNKDELVIYGRRGSAVGMVKRIAQLKNLEETDGHGVFELINKGDQQALEIFHQYCYDIARLISNLQIVLDVEAFAIGGGISQQEIVTATIQSYYKKIAEPLQREYPIILTTKWKNDANLIGAVQPLFD